jgi:hypothetical protein
MKHPRDPKTKQFVKKGEKAIAHTPTRLRLYQEDYDRIKDLENRSEIIREAVAQYLKNYL